MKLVRMMCMVFGLVVSCVAATADSLTVQVGYADTVRVYNPFTPTPFCGSPEAHFGGSSPNAGCGQLWDGGVILLTNTGADPIIVTDVSVSIGQTVFDLWNEGGAFSIAPGQSEVLTQLTYQDFDTSDVPLSEVCCDNDGLIPSITIAFDGGTATLLDTSQILNTGGTDEACVNGCNNTNEGHLFVPLGTVSSTPEPAGLTLVGVACLGLAWFWRKRLQRGRMADF